MKTWCKAWSTGERAIIQDVHCQWKETGEDSAVVRAYLAWSCCCTRLLQWECEIHGTNITGA